MTELQVKAGVIKAWQFNPPQFIEQKLAGLGFKVIVMKEGDKHGITLMPGGWIVADPRIPDTALAFMPDDKFRSTYEEVPVKKL